MKWAKERDVKLSDFTAEELRQAEEYRLAQERQQRDEEIVAECYAKLDAELEKELRWEEEEVAPIIERFARGILPTESEQEVLRCSMRSFPDDLHRLLWPPKPYVRRAKQ
jgi:hypothetical protein